MSFSIDFDFKQLNAFMEFMAAAKINNAKSELMEALGGLIVGQTQERIDTEKTDPEGKKWSSWEPSTALQRHKGHSLLMWQQNLLGSVDYEKSGDEVKAGSNMEYAGYLQEGTKHMPARAFLGLSAENKKDVDLELKDWMQRYFNAG